MWLYSKVLVGTFKIVVLALGKLNSSQEKKRSARARCSLVWWVGSGSVILGWAGIPAIGLCHWRSQILYLCLTLSLTWIHEKINICLISSVYTLVDVQKIKRMIGRIFTHKKNVCKTWTLRMYMFIETAKAKAKNLRWVLLGTANVNVFLLIPNCLACIMELVLRVE